jgi:hypothetical protein
MTMSEENNTKQLVDQFIFEQIESVPHLEALLLLWRASPRSWSLAEMTKSLYLETGVTENILDDLVRRGLLVKSASGTNEWQYASEPGRDLLIQRVDKTYRAELIRISRLIHSKRSTHIQEFARAFRFKKN